MLDGSIKIGVLVIAKIVVDGLVPGKTVHDTLEWRFHGPEVSPGICFTTKADIFALGVSVYWLLTKRYPFPDLMTVDMDDPLPLPPSISGEMQALVMSMLDKTQASRPSTAAIEGSALIRPASIPILVWRDPNVRDLRENEPQLRKLQADFAGQVTIIACETSRDAGAVIDSTEDKHNLFLVTSRNDAVGFLRVAIETGVPARNMLVLCGSVVGWETARSGD
jgi:serine/threonine protein kinase